MSSNPAPTLLVVVGLVLLCGQGVLSLGFGNSAHAGGSCMPQQEMISFEEPERAAALVEKLWENPDAAACELQKHSMDQTDLKRTIQRIQRRSDLQQRFESHRRTLRANAG